MYSCSYFIDHKSNEYNYLITWTWDLLVRLLHLPSLDILSSSVLWWLADLVEGVVLADCEELWEVFLCFRPEERLECFFFSLVLPELLYSGGSSEKK